MTSILKENNKDHISLHVHVLILFDKQEYFVLYMSHFTNKNNTVK